MNRKNFDKDRREFGHLAEEFTKKRISRREFLRGVGVLGGALAFAGPVSTILASCTPQQAAAPTTAATSVATVGTKSWPITNMTSEQLADVYKNILPLTNVLPLPEGPIGDKPIVIGSSQTGFNHPWRVEMIKSAQAEVARHSNVSLVVTDGNVDITKQNNDVDDLLAQNVDAVVMSPVEIGQG